MMKIKLGMLTLAVALLFGIVEAVELTPETCDVVVVGGGSAGICAALQSARAGAKTVLVEAAHQVGGNTTTGGVNFPGLFHAWGQQVIAGAGWDLVTNTVAMHGGKLPDFTEPTGRQHPKHQVVINIPLFVVLAEDELTRAGVTIHYHAAPIRIEPCPTGWRLITAAVGDTRTITCKQLVDCTGNGTVAALLGFKRLQEEERQPGTFAYRTRSNADLSNFDAKELQTLYNAAVKDGRLQRNDCRWGLFQYLKSGGSTANYVEGADNSTADARTETNLRGRAAALRMIRFIKSIPGLEKITLESMSPEVGIRETYRVQGEYLITHQDYTSGKHWPDSVCYAFYPIDLHDNKSGVHPAHLTEGVVATVPLRALIPKGSENLLVAGRCLSSDRMANSALRVQATCMATGQAAGAAAALAAKKGITPGAVPIEELKTLLRANGAVAVGDILTLIQDASANAPIIAYDGFADGGMEDGRKPGAASYTTSPLSINGLDRDSLHAQSPISTGFTNTSAWSVTNSLISSNLYYQAQKGGLMYKNFKPCTSGQAGIIHGAGTTSKLATRDAVTTDTSDVQWVAMLVNFNSEPSPDSWYQDFIVTLEYGDPGCKTAPYDGAWTPATFGVRQSDGKAFYRTATGSSKVDVETASALTAGTHLFLLKFDHGYPGDSRYDNVTLWVDPVLTDDPNDLTGGLSAVSIMRSDLGGGMHPFDRLIISASVKDGNEIVFDEFIITGTYADIMTPEKRVAFQSVNATYIRSRDNDVERNFNDNGQIIVGVTEGSDPDILRGLIEFNISTIPASNQITSVSLFLTTHSAGINNVGAPGALSTFNLYSYAFDIDETTATWNAPDVNTNDVPGATSGPLLAVASCDVALKGLRIMFGDTAVFRAAVADAINGNGFIRLIIRGDYETVGTHNFVRFSDETVNPLINRPELLIFHMCVPPQGTIMLIA